MFEERAPFLVSVLGVPLFLGHANVELAVLKYPAQCCGPNRAKQNPHFCSQPLKMKRTQQQINKKHAKNSEGSRERNKRQIRRWSPPN